MTWQEPRTSAQHKLIRGVEQVRALDQEAKAFVDADAYVFRVEPEIVSEREIRFRTFAVEQTAPPDHWPLLAGEAVHNLRCALDHAIHAASAGGKTKFPIFTDPDKFEANRAKVLNGLPPPVQARVEAAQPYVNYPAGPKEAGLAVLQRLSNDDKHRELATVASAVQHEWVGLASSTVETTWEKYATNRPLGRGETEVSVVLVKSADANLATRDVEHGFDYEVRIEEMEIGILTTISRDVYRAVIEVETGEQLSIWAPYPI